MDTETPPFILKKISADLFSYKYDGKIFVEDWFFNPDVSRQNYWEVVFAWGHPHIYEAFKILTLEGKHCLQAIISLLLASWNPVQREPSLLFH